MWITDFGLARAVNAPEVTLSGDLTGTLRYLAPERLSGQADPQCDVYSLGLTLYEMIVLDPAYKETEYSKLLHQISTQTPPRPKSINPHVPADLETVILKAISISRSTATLRQRNWPPTF